MNALANLSGLTVPKLKGKCRELGLAVGGRKADLIRRIQARLPAVHPGASPATEVAESNGISGPPPLPQEEIGTARGRTQSKRKRETSAIRTPNGSDVIRSRAKKAKAAGTVGADPQDNTDGEAKGLDVNRLIRENRSPVPTTAHSADGADTVTFSSPSSPLLGGACLGPVLPGPSRGFPTLALFSEKQQTPGTRKKSAAHAPQEPQKGPNGAEQETPNGFPINCAGENITSSLHARSRGGRDNSARPKFIGLTVGFQDMTAGISKLVDITPAVSASDHPEGMPAIGLIRKPTSGNLGMPLNKVRRFKGLKVDGNLTNRGVTSMHQGDETPSLPSIGIEFKSPLLYRLPKDHEIQPSTIRNPPRISRRRRVEKLAEVLALVAFYSLDPSPGNFLRLFSDLSGTYRYASILAFTHLVLLEFPGTRTQAWLATKRVDKGVADVRAWYWHRTSERDFNIERLRTSWMERVWRFLAYEEDSSYNGLRFAGISHELLAEPELQGQWGTAVRFWVRRFHMWVTKNGGGYQELLEDLRVGIIKGTEPLNTTGEVWRVRDGFGGELFVVGATGEVVGWSEINLKLGPQSWRGQPFVEVDRPAPWVGLADAIGDIPQSSDRTSAPPLSLRQDYAEQALRAFLPFAPPKIPPGVIHESVILQHHLALAERWVLAQTEVQELNLHPTLLVESIRCEGERWKSDMKGVLAQGVGFVQTSETGWFVLSETGQNIAQEEYGIQGMWATVLGVREDGAALGETERLGLKAMFTCRDVVDDR